MSSNYSLFDVEPMRRAKTCSIRGTVSEDEYGPITK